VVAVGLEIKDEGPDQPGGSMPQDFFQVVLAMLEYAIPFFFCATNEV
jgi:hypothetical protein